jgi:predicted secreted protein
MGIGTGIAIYLTLWWTTLFAVLPLGNRTYAEEGIEVKDGGDPGAPVNPNLKRKFITTTWVSALSGRWWLVLKFWPGQPPQMPSS